MKIQSKIIGLILLSLSLTQLTGCMRQQGGIDTVFNKEKPSDFTRVTQSIQMTPPPMIPGRAAIPGAPFQDFTTQTGSAFVEPTTPVLPQDSSQTQAPQPNLVPENSTP